MSWGRDDVSFVILTKTEEGLLVTTGKGRPKKEVSTTISSGFVFDRYNSTFDGDSKKRSLKLSDSQSLLLAVAWTTDDEVLLMEMFPEVWFLDVTAGTNKEGRGLFLVVDKDSNNMGFTGVRILLLSEQLWVFDWIFRHCLASLLPSSTIRRNKVCITDGDPQMHGALGTKQAHRNIWCGDHAICQWHLLLVGWHETVSKASIRDCVEVSTTEKRVFVSLN